MKIIIFTLLFLFSFVPVFPESSLQQDMYFKIMGVKELRDSPDFGIPPVHNTLNHENGLECRILTTGDKANSSNTSGQWYYVLTTCGIWVQSGDWIPKYSKFWIFITDEDVLYDIEI